jgi:hypothetical protein
LDRIGPDVKQMALRISRMAIGLRESAVLWTLSIGSKLNYAWKAGHRVRIRQC